MSKNSGIIRTMSIMSVIAPIIPITLITPIITLLLCSCERRPLTYDYHPYCNVAVDVDWSRFSETPSGMTVIFYPENDAAPVVHTTNSVHSTKVNLREGRYDVLVFNQSPDEFGTINFRGLDKFSTAEAYAAEAASRWYGESKADEEIVAHEPEPLAFDTFEGFVVTEEMVEAEMAAKAAMRTPASKATVTLRPRDITAKGNIKVRVKGIHNLRSVRATISGMAQGHFPAKSITGASTVTHLLENWQKETDPDDYTEGYISTSYSSFGLPEMPINRNTINQEDLKLNLSFLLVDNKTVMDFKFLVGNHVAISLENGDIVIDVNLETNPGDDSPNPEAPPVSLPDVKPEGGSAGGFDATVDDWGEEVEIDVIM